MPAGITAYYGSLLHPMYAAVINGRSVIGPAIPPLPNEIRARLARSRIPERVLPRAGPELPEIPSVANAIPEDVQISIDRARVRERQPTPSLEPLDHWRVTFVSATPREPALTELQRRG
jgi:hypothetical protein